MNNKKLVPKKIITKNYLSPEYLYFKINDHVKYHIDGKSKVLKEQLLFTSNGENTYSTISGKVLGTKEIDKNNYLVLQNDYKEKFFSKKILRKKISNLTKKEMLDILKESECINYSSNIKYFINNYNNIDSLVLKLVVCEDAEKIYPAVFNIHNSDIMEIFDTISQIFEIKNPIIMISDTDEENIEYVSNLSGMYPNIRITLTHDKYPSSHPLLIARKLNLTNALVLTPVDLYYLFTIIKRDKKVIEKEVLVTGDNLKTDYLITTKLNVLVSDILKECKIKMSNDYIICKNSAIRGEVINPYDVLTSSVDSLVIVKKDNSVPKECINCGLCNKCCPQKLNPQLYKLTGKPFPGKCIDCNMCSYVCPCKIGRIR
jgi:Na+-translocating ferredoxin:NAD+ oxidoreductase RnfC subunit